jgi:hypothetical protein
MTPTSSHLSTLAVVSAITKIVHFYLSSRIKRMETDDSASSHSLAFHTKAVLLLLCLFIIDTVILITALPFLVDAAAITIADCLSLTPLLWLILCQYSVYCYDCYSDRSNDDRLEWQLDMAYIVYQTIRLCNNSALAYLKYQQYGTIGDMSTLLIINLASICKRILEWQGRRQSVQQLVSRMKTADLSDTDNVEMCLICRDSLIPSKEDKYNPAKRLPNCCHLYHQQCLVDWLSCRLQCPACRRAVK